LLLRSISFSVANHDISFKPSSEINAGQTLRPAVKESTPEFCAILLPRRRAALHLLSNKTIFQ